MRHTRAGGVALTAPASPADPSAQPVSTRFTWVGLLIVGVIAMTTLVLLSSLRSARPRANPIADALAAAAPDPRFARDRWFLPGDALLGFVAVPAGDVVIGGDRSTDPLAFDNERWSPAATQHTVHVPEFYIGRYEVTTAQFLAFAAAAGSRLHPQVPIEASARPVTFVSWPDALAYTRWLHATLAASSQTPAPLRALLAAGWRVTLPSEVQWEKAARGGDRRRYPWGADPRRDRAVYGGAAQPAPVGSTACPECPYGLADMSGNVWEWTRSPYRPFIDDAAALPDLRADALWVMKGGSFADSEGTIRATTRGGADPGVRRGTIGFRVAIVPPEVTSGQ